MVTIPILIRSTVVNLVRLRNADHIMVTADLVDYIHTPLAASDQQTVQSFSLDWWNQTPFPTGQEQPVLWMNFDAIGRCHKTDKIPDLATTI